MKNVRVVNGYRLLFLPDHPKAMSNSNWVGYVYEHIVVVEKRMGRPLARNEVVHHLDGNRSNNRWENLLVIDRGQHAKLHAWFNRGAPGMETLRRNGVDSTNAKEKEPTYCVCGTLLQLKQGTYCSRQCVGLAQRKVNHPDAETLKKELATSNYLALGKKYGVSNNAVKKWALQYGFSKRTLSRAEGTPSEGAETSGEVQSS